MASAMPDLIFSDEDSHRLLEFPDLAFFLAKGLIHSLLHK
jgi:hypothetical protein